MPDSFEDLQFTSDAQRLYFTEARLGIEVEDFLRSNTGKLLQHRAVQQYETAKEAMCHLDMDRQEDLATYKRHKFQLELANQFLRWCAEAIQNGHTSEQLVNDLEERQA